MVKEPGGIMAAGIVLDVTIVCAVASIAYGSWLVFPPSGFIVGGLLTLVLALGLVAGASKNTRSDAAQRTGSRP